MAGNSGSFFLTPKEQLEVLSCCQCSGISETLHLEICYFDCMLLGSFKVEPGSIFFCLFVFPTVFSSYYYPFISSLPPCKLVRALPRLWENLN